MKYSINNWIQSNFAPEACEWKTPSTILLEKVFALYMYTNTWRQGVDRRQSSLQGFASGRRSLHTEYSQTTTWSQIGRIQVSISLRKGGHHRKKYVRRCWVARDQMSSSPTTNASSQIARSASQTTTLKSDGEDPSVRLTAKR
jgi:hypothetical protein